ncbi:MAG: hypothetical protein K2Q18_15510 [Bdellovibrionales bacterium]|nr:hypothetical protein [Bdellovibrionales bacterium]
MKSAWNKRSSSYIKFLKKLFWPLIKVIFRLDLQGQETLVNTPTLYISNHNIGALIESHSILFGVDDRFGDDQIVFGFTHPSIFNAPGIKHYFELVGAVPATYEVAADVFSSGNSLLIFPGGNKQALRSIFDYKKNSFRKTHGWAKIAKSNGVDVVPVTFYGSHFVNPVLNQSGLLAKLLIFPYALGLKWLSVSLGQIIITWLFVTYMQYLSVDLWLYVPLAIIIFSITPLTIIFPAKIKMKFHPRLSHKLSQDELEDEVEKIMNQIYNE